MTCAATLGRAAVFAFLVFGRAGLAATLPPPTTLVECVDFTVTDDPGSCSVSGRDAAASASLALSPFVFLVAHSESGPINSLFNPGAGAVGFVTYSFQVQGGNPGDIVPMFISANLTASASSASHALGQAETLVHTSFGNTDAVVCTNGNCGTTATSFSGTFGFNTLSGEGGDFIQLSVEAQSGDSLFAEFADASADPLIFIDPSFANAGSYSIVLSPGVANALGSVPEPGTWVLFASAVALALCRAAIQKVRS